ncbi:universal stress protein [Streptomyces mirabilis]|uniref:universal stress protein n=1 Tax=Streptomyces mirabilis TaxID=68239 RepID=UPI0036E43059
MAVPRSVGCGRPSQGPVGRTRTCGPFFHRHTGDRSVSTSWRRLRSCPPVLSPSAWTGSPESLVAADRAAREAVLRVAPSRLVHACGQQPHAYVPFAGEVPSRGADRSVQMLREVETSLTCRHPGLRITADQIDQRPVAALAAVARKAQLVVLGSRGLGRGTGHLPGSVALSVAACAERPRSSCPSAWAVRLGSSRTARNRPEATSCRSVVLGLGRH